MKTMYEKLEEQRAEKAYFIKQRLYGLFIVVTGLLMIGFANITIAELKMCGIALICIGMPIIITKEKALG